MELLSIASRVFHRTMITSASIMWPLSPRTWTFTAIWLLCLQLIGTNYRTLLQLLLNPVRLRRRTMSLPCQTSQGWIYAASTPPQAFCYMDSRPKTRSVRLREIWPQGNTRTPNKVSHIMASSTLQRPTIAFTATSKRARRANSSKLSSHSGGDTWLIRQSDHINRKHVRRFECLDCSRSFNLRSDLMRHKNSVHADIRRSTKVYRCLNAGCLKTYTRKDHLGRHARACEYRNWRNG